MRQFELQAPRPAPAAAEGAPRLALEPSASGIHLALREKAVLFVTALVLYALASMLAVALLWRESAANDSQIQRMRTTETEVELLQSSLSHAIINLQDAMKSGNAKDLDTDVALLISDAMRLVGLYPSLEPLSERIERDMSGVSSAPTGASAESLRAGLERMGREVKAISDHIHNAKNDLVNAQLRHQRVVATVGGALIFLGVALVGALIVAFFRRLSLDIRRLETRAFEIVDGYSGPPLPVTRTDEVGGLMAALNRTQAALREREKQVELARQERFYQDKMAAIGSLAAGVAHEINNPIAAISGIAQQINENVKKCDCGMGLCRADLILEQTNRIAGISRQLAELATSHSEEPELLDLNGLVERTTSFIGYDKRFRKVSVQLDLDRSVPAIHAVADHLTQVLMNLLINAADALEGAPVREGAIRVATRAAGNEVELVVSDNGHGMDAATLERVFDEAFTTKPRDKGRGLGLFLCRSLLEKAGGRIALESAPGAGTSARVVLPVKEAVAA